MDWKLASSTVTLPIEFMVEGDYVIPDSESIKLTLRNTTGSVIAGFNALLLDDVSGSTMALTIPPEANSLGSGATFEARFVRIDFKVQGLPYAVQAVYRIAPFLPIQATKQEVRDLIGAQYNELPDSAIDLVGAYYTLMVEHADVLPQALTATGTAAMAANKALALQAAIDTAPSWPMRLVVTESQDTTQYRRPKVDFAKLRDSLEAQLVAQLALMAALVNDASNAISPLTLLVLTSPTDVITNA